MNRAQYIYTYLTSNGVSSIDAYGILGNMWVETGGTLSPTAYNSKEGAIGLIQWEGGRRTALQQWAASHGGQETDLDIQLSFLIHEMNSGESSAWGIVKTASTVTQAASLWDQDYERSSGEARQQRISAANSFAQSLTWNGGGGSVPNTGTFTKANAGKIKPGSWTTYKGKKLRDPTGFASYNKSNKSNTGWVTLPSWGYNTTSVKLAWQWLWDYYDDGELQSQYPSATRETPPGMPDNGDVSGLTWTWILNNAVEYAPNAANKEVGIPDEGAATGEGYVGDAVKGAIGAAKDAVSWTASLGEILSWLTDKKKRERLAIFMLGALILLVIVLKEFGPDLAPIAAEAALA